MKQDLRVIKTKLALRHAMIDLLAKKPFRKITISDITQAAMTSRATFYAHFVDKYDLLGYALASLKQDLIDQVADDAADSLLRRTIRHMYDHPTMFCHLLEGEGSLELTRMMEEMLIDDLRSGSGSDERISAEQEIVEQYVIGGMIQILKMMVRQNFRRSPDLITDQLIRIRDMFLEEFGRP